MNGAQSTSVVMDGSTKGSAGGKQPVVALEEVQQSMSGVSINPPSTPPVGEPPSATAPSTPATTKVHAKTESEGDKDTVVSEKVCQSIERGMRIINDIEQTRADGMVFKFEMDLMYAVRPRDMRRFLPDLQ